MSGDHIRATARSMAEVLLGWADQIPDDLAFCFLIDGEEEGPRLTYAALDRRARAVATALRDVAEPGDRALLLYAPGLEFVSAFFGCLYAGVVAVPAYPPRPLQGWQPLADLAADCRPRAVLLDDVVAPFVPAGDPVPALAAAARIVTDDLDPAGGRRWHPPAFDPDAVAMLQYTSGTTAAPRGVVLSNRNLLHNEAVMHAAFEHCGPGVGVSWLPPYHDMGLIGSILQSAYHGAASYLMSPVAFLQDPARWLAAASRYRADTSGGPNFAYDLCVQRIPPERRAGLDLSNWSVVGVGAEPVCPDTLDRFATAFGPCGFRPEAFYPCYGLAEATLMVTGGAKGAGPVVRSVCAEALEAGRAEPGTRAVVGCGRPRDGLDVQVVDPESCLGLSDARVGEIWVRGPSVARGYWGRPAETAETFDARLAGSGEGPYLRTGDLGYLQDGQLFVTGRIKDVIIVRGRNHYPQDVEQTVQSVHTGLRAGGGAAFEASRDGRPGVVVVQEVDRKCRALDADQVVADARQAVAERHQLQVHDLVLVASGSIPKTSSGKVRRGACRVEYDRGRLRLWERPGA